MKSIGLFFAVLLLPATAFCWSKQMDFDCAELGPGAKQSYLQAFPVRNKFAAQIVVSVEASNIGTADKPKCHVQWTFTGKSAGAGKTPGRSTLLFRYTDEPEHGQNGVSFEGTSPDGSKLLLDLFATVNDRTLHRPVVYEFLAAGWQIRPVGDKVSRHLPANCNYFTMISGVTNDGNVILYVPKSPGMDAGCPDQGEWLLDMKADTVSRVEAHAPSKPTSSR
jgi:hypothetical protein